MKQPPTPGPAALHWSAAAGTALTAAVYLALWLFPGRELDLTRSFVVAFALEFFIVHAGIMVPAARSAGRARAALIAGAYVLIAVAVGLGFGLWTFIGFAYLTALEIVPSLRARAEELALTALAGLGKALLYLAVLFAAMLLPVPRLGVSPEIESALALSISGVTDPGPQNVLCAGVVYFSILAWVRGRLPA